MGLGLNRNYNFLLSESNIFVEGKYKSSTKQSKFRRQFLTKIGFVISDNVVGAQTRDFERLLYLLRDP